MKITLLSVITASIVLVGCQNKKLKDGEQPQSIQTFNSVTVVTDTPTTTPEQKLQAEKEWKERKVKQDSIASKLAAVKDVEDYELAFLHGGIDKAVLILGEPDDKMESIKGGNGVYIWYDRTKKYGKIRNLVIEYLHYEVRQVIPVNDNATFYSSKAEPVKFERQSD